jgi:hypothetical protein
MTDFVPGVVMPVGPGRHEFANKSLKSIYAGDITPAACVVVADGWTPDSSLEQIFPTDVRGFRVANAEYIFHETRKHEPGREQPRNIGVRVLRDHFAECTHVWFADSDLIFERSALAEFKKAYEKIRDNRAILIGPYEWMPSGNDQPMPKLRNDPRWPFFNETEAGDIQTGLNAGLACFSGNLVWNIDEFIRIGGFWNEIHHGRCEDGELGIRAYAQGMAFAPVANARGWHMDHPRNHQRILEMNARDVPMLNERHPWVEQHGVFVAERDGKRFDQTCAICGQVVNTIDWWQHQETHS